MSDQRVEKDLRAGRQGERAEWDLELGFEPESFMGFALPFLIVMVIGGFGGLLIWKWL